MVNLDFLNVGNLFKSAKRTIAYEELRTIKARYASQGYMYQHSFYYFISVKGESRYRRVEVISNFPFSPRQIDYIHRMFSLGVSGFDYSLWLWNPLTYELHCAWVVDRHDRE